ncbi:MAG: lipoprotein [Rhizobiaceae bacterium]|nr:lipoprotein [Rhizobiaceae bacterium]
MAQRLSGFATRFVLVLMIALAVTACGRRGNLEAPPSATVVTVDENGNEVETVGAPEKEDKPFILDPLL